MNYEKFGIIITFIILFTVCGFIGIAQLELIDTPYIPSITQETSTNAYYDWCDKMKIVC